MRKKYVFGSAMVVLLMLVSTQVMFLNIVRSDPEAHEGDANVGNIWLSELDVSSDIVTFDYIGISHVNATDDWVIWANGAGNINTSWSVDIEARNHPEYYVIFSLSIINVDDDNKEIGNDTFSKTYTAGLDYDESGTLSVAIEFTQQQQQMQSQTLVCYLNGLVKINNTIEAENFTVWADDRSIVAVDFITPETQPPFSIYRREANDQCPNMWSWMPGWESQFSAEDEMLDGQSVLVGGAKKMFEDDGNPDWHLGNFTVTSYKNGILENPDVEDSQNMVNWSNNSGTHWVYGNTYMWYDVDADQSGWNPPILFIYYFEGLNNQTGKMQRMSWQCRLWSWYDENNTGYMGSVASFTTGWANENNLINCQNRVFMGNLRPRYWYNETLTGYEVNVSCDGTGSTPDCEDNNVTWLNKCAVINESYTFSTSSDTSGGVTTITGDISNGIARENEIVYMHAADNGDTRIELTC